LNHHFGGFCFLRVDNIKKYGYNLEVIWECDLDKPNNLKTILKKYERKN
jgi:G:T-mismatch repair DNA endonuclease (very short patch repair protein)